jgi:hypothetical protein
MFIKKHRSPPYLMSMFPPVYLSPSWCSVARTPEAHKCRARSFWIRIFADTANTTAGRKIKNLFRCKVARVGQEVAQALGTSDDCAPACAFPHPVVVPSITGENRFGVVFPVRHGAQVPDKNKVTRAFLPEI